MTQVSVRTELLAKALNLADSAGDNETAEALRALLPQPDEARELLARAMDTTTIGGSSFAIRNGDKEWEPAVAIIRDALNKAKEPQP